MQTSKRKPFNLDAGYKASRRTSFGWVVIYDRNKGGDWIDGDTRWVVAAYNQEQGNIGLLDCETRALAITTMKLAQSGECVDWIDFS